MTDQHPAVTFLLAAHVKAEALAEAASCPEPGCLCRSWQNLEMDGELRDDRNAGTIAMIPRRLVRAHIALHDPAAVLARVAAERDILWEHTPEAYELGRCAACVTNRILGPGLWVTDPWPCRTVLGLAAAWGWKAET